MTNESLKWDEGALKKMEEVPAFLRSMVKGKIEKAAVEHGIQVITAEFLEQMKKKMMGS